MTRRSKLSLFNTLFKFWITQETTGTSEGVILDWMVQYGLSLR